MKKEMILFVLVVVGLLLISGCNQGTAAVGDGSTQKENEDNAKTGYVSEICNIEKIEFKNEADTTSAGWGAVDNEQMHIYHYHRDTGKDAADMEITVSGCSGWDLKLNFNPDSHKQLCTYGKQFSVEKKAIIGPIISFSKEIYPETWCDGRDTCIDNPKGCDCVVNSQCTSAAATKPECKASLCDSYYKLTVTAQNPSGETVEMDGYYYINVIDYSNY